MKYPYSVKHNGKYYRPNQEIPDDVTKNVETPVETVENPVETVETEKKPTKRAKKD